MTDEERHRRATGSRPAQGTGSARTGSARTGSAPTGSARAVGQRQPVRSPGRSGLSGRSARTAPATARRPPRPPRPPRRPRRPRVLALGDPRRRLQGSILFLGLVLSLLGGRLVQIQGLDARAYAATAEKSRLRVVTLPAVRGGVLDATGFALASSVEAVNVTADQTRVVDPAGSAAKLAPLLGLDPQALAARLTGTRRFVYLAKLITPSTWRRVVALDLAGIYSEEATRRVYPAGTLAANVVGFVGADGHGLGGLEATQDSRLAGRSGKAAYEVGAGGRRLPLAADQETPALDGSDVQLTINRDIQWVAEDALRRKVAETGSASGYVIVMDPRTGAVLAMAVTPGFDPSVPATAAARGNGAVSDAFEPGSTGKIITAAALIDTNAITPMTPITVPAKLYRAGTSFKDFHPHGVEHLTYAGTIAKSSNMGTILAAEHLKGGLAALAPYFTKFGLGKPTGAGLPGENPGAVRAPAAWSATTGYTMAFGQGYSVNALQMTSVFATIANGGLRVPPRVVAGWRSPSGTFTPAPAAPAVRVVSPQAAAVVRTMLEAVVMAGGTAPKAQIAGYRVAGKTGTANRYDDALHKYAGYTYSFIGMAPADAPRLVVSVTLQNPKSGAGGGATGGPVFHDVMSFALAKLGIPPTGTPPPVVPLTTGAPTTGAPTTGAPTTGAPTTGAPTTGAAPVR